MYGKGWQILVTLETLADEDEALKEVDARRELFKKLR